MYTYILSVCWYVCACTCAACSSCASLRALCALSRSLVRLSTLCERALASSAPLEDRSLSYTHNTTQHSTTHHNTTLHNIKTCNQSATVVHPCVLHLYLYDTLPVSAAVCAVPVGCLALPPPCVVWIGHCPPPLAAHSHGQTLHIYHQTQERRHHSLHIYQTQEKRRHTTVW